MKQAIAGVAPTEFAEVTIMSVWPSISVYGPGRLLGRLFLIQWPGVYFFRLGNLLALLAIPVSLPLYLLRTRIRYTLTNRRVVMFRGLKPTEEKSVELDRFDRIEIQIRDGQQWFHSGDLVFYRDNVETFRLEAVSRPDAFRHTCLKAGMGYRGVKQALARTSGAAV